jgi:hypothetical protein
MAKTASRIRGIALAPGVSRNGRLYTRENIRRAVQRAQGRIKAGQMVMLTHHDANDDSTHIVGRVTSLTQDEAGAARFEAELAPTGNGKVIRKLVKGPQPFLKGVSIRGRWQGRVRTVNGAETADDLEIEGLDFTHRPGVPDAQILAESAGGKAAGLIFEEAPRVTLLEAQRPGAVDRAQKAYDARIEELARMTVEQLAERMPETWASSRNSKAVYESKAPKAAQPPPADEGPSAADLARMPEDEFLAMSADWGVRRQDAVRGTFQPTSASSRDLG